MKKINVTRISTYSTPLTLIACVIIVIAAVVIAGNHDDISQSIKTATTHKPENFTELYFSEYTKMPKTVIVGTEYPVPFVIANHESKDFKYFFQTELIEKNSVRKGKLESVTVADGKSIRRTAYINALFPGEQVELVIKVLNKNLMIHYKAQS